jgi:hypothetical protein
MLMIRTLKTSLTIALLLTLGVIAKPCSADGPPPPPPGGIHGGGGSQPPGGGVPIGEGITLLMVMSIGYGLERILYARNKNTDEIATKEE